MLTFTCPRTSLSGKSGCLLIHLSNVPQMPIFRAFSHFVIPRKSTFSYYFLYRLVQNWYKIGTKIVPQDPAIIILLQHIQDWYENAVSRLFNVISIFNLKCSFFLCPSFLNIFFYQLHQLFGCLNLFLSLDLSSYIKIIIITGMSYFF